MKNKYLIFCLLLIAPFALLLFLSFFFGPTGGFRGMLKWAFRPFYLRLRNLDIFLAGAAVLRRCCVLLVFTSARLLINGCIHLYVFFADN